MAAPRFTLDKASYAKILFRAKKKPTCATLVAKFKETKITMSPAQDAIFWNPNPELLREVYCVLFIELAERRTRKGKPFELASSTVAALKEFVNSNSDTPVEDPVFEEVAPSNPTVL